MTITARRAAAALAGSAAAILLSAGPSFAAGINAGPATQAPATGTSDTLFKLNLPVGAACTGDSATGGYLVYSYIVPSTVDPSTLSFNSNGPVTPGGTSASNGVYPLYDSTGSPYVAKNTAVATGTVPASPNFVYGGINGFTISELPAGSYNIGTACAKSGVIDKFWNAVETITAAPVSGTNSGGFTFAFVPPPPPAVVPEARFAIALPVSAVALAGAGALVLRRRRSAARA